ncbi:MAG: hypothetical protein HKL90_10740, partial [Elusimicrobia bacterium]|nr:hypothetical protein [Elusimicrobiota bacterium]
MKTLWLAALIAPVLPAARAQTAPPAPASTGYQLTLPNQDIDVSIGAFQPTARFGIVAGDKS